MPRSSFKQILKVQKRVYHRPSRRLSCRLVPAICFYQPYVALTRQKRLSVISITWQEARRIAANIAKLPELVRKE